MAKFEADREDLLAEGVNFPWRGRLTDSSSREWMIGWRGESLQSSAMSLFVNTDPVFHFNGDGNIRRAHIDGIRLAAQESELCKLVRVPDKEGRLVLARNSLSAEQHETLQVRLAGLLAELVTTISDPASRIEVVGLDEVTFLQSIQKWMQDHPAPFGVARIPNIVS